MTIKELKFILKKKATEIYALHNMSAFLINFIHHDYRFFFFFWNPLIFSFWRKNKQLIKIYDNFIG